MSDIEAAEQIIFANRRVPSERSLGTPGFQEMLLDMGELAEALNCLDPAADVTLLKVAYSTESTMTLEEMITRNSFPEAGASLTGRLRLALKVAKAVFVLHLAGSVHKNITSSSVVAPRRPIITDRDILLNVDECYLMEFDLVRGSDATTTREVPIKGHGEQQSIWDFEAFQHPDRLLGPYCPRYVNTYDVYSLGVLLLEVALWEPLRSVARDLIEVEPSSWAIELSGIIPQIGPRAGDRYKSLVAWCLSLKGDHIVRGNEFVQVVLYPLEEMVNCLC